jgi:hypothetical protein
VLLTAAGYLCVVHLCGGTKGHAINPQDADGAFPYIGELGGDQNAMFTAVRRRVFQGDGPGRIVPIHRTIAEYLGGQFFAGRVRAGLPLKRALSLLTGDDGGTLGVAWSLRVVSLFVGGRGGNLNSTRSAWACVIRRRLITFSVQQTDADG